MANRAPSDRRVTVSAAGVDHQRSRLEVLRRERGVQVVLVDVSLGRQCEERQLWRGRGLKSSGAEAAGEDDSSVRLNVQGGDLPEEPLAGARLEPRNLLPYVAVLVELHQDRQRT